jgi:hypothetical protein
MALLREMVLTKLNEDFVIKAEQLTNKFILTTELKTHFDIIIELMNIQKDKNPEAPTLAGAQPHENNEKSLKKSTEKEKQELNELLKKLKSIIEEQNEKIQQEKKQKEKNENSQTAGGNNSKTKKEKKDTQKTKSSGGKNQENQQQKDLKDILNQLESQEENFKPSDEIKTQLEKENQQLKAYRGAENCIFSKNGAVINEISKTTNLLRSLRADLNQETTRNLKRGILDIKKLICNNKENDLNVFKKPMVTDRLNKSKIAISMLLDGSGSMEYQTFNTALKSAFILTKSLEALKNEIEIYEFSNNYVKIKAFRQNGAYYRNFHNFTYLAPAINEASRSLNEFSKQNHINNKFIFVLSDGVFSDNDLMEQEKTLEIIQKTGIKILWIFIGSMFKPNFDRIAKKFNYAIQIENIGLLTRELRKILNKIQQDINKNILGA